MYDEIYTAVFYQPILDENNNFSRKKKIKDFTRT